MIENNALDKTTLDCYSLSTIMPVFVDRSAELLLLSMK